MTPTTALYSYLEPDAVETPLSYHNTCEEEVFSTAFEVSDQHLGQNRQSIDWALIPGFTERWLPSSELLPFSSAELATSSSYTERIVHLLALRKPSF
jgi:hypothetical protein